MARAFSTASQVQPGPGGLSAQSACVHSTPPGAPSVTSRVASGRQATLLAAFCCCTYFR